MYVITKIRRKVAKIYEKNTSYVTLYYFNDTHTNSYRKPSGNNF